MFFRNIYSPRAPVCLKPRCSEDSCSTRRRILPRNPFFQDIRPQWGIPLPANRSPRLSGNSKDLLRTDQFNLLSFFKSAFYCFRMHVSELRFFKIGLSLYVSLVNNPSANFRLARSFCAGFIEHVVMR
ncbi:unnamed protein product, partial [Nesidiocoris tenuis]